MNAGAALLPVLQGRTPARGRQMSLVPREAPSAAGAKADTHLSVRSEGARSSEGNAMTTISLTDWMQSPEIVVGKTEHHRLTVVALTHVGERGRNADLLLYELDRARIIPDGMVPADVVRIGSIVRYAPVPGVERTAKLVLPDNATGSGGYSLPVTSEHGAALLGTRPGHQMAWLDRDGAVQRLQVIAVTNDDPHDDPGPLAA
ncbi:MAG: nucleoside diphosphate kinase regulator [Devosia sp.]|jgi:regulator of nucleoside diphosphate kinase|nr:nucleoside diphosphate kinase regulator [Devosia sp.]